MISMIYDLRGLKTIDDLRRIRLGDVGIDRLMTQEEIEHPFRILQAFWQYPGAPCADVPHAVTREGDHTDGFISCMHVLEWANLCEILANQQVLRLEQMYRARFDKGLPKIGLVVDAAYSGTDYGKDVTRCLAMRQERSPAHRTVEKDKDGNPTQWRGRVSANQLVLVVNELMTTPWGSTQMAKNAVKEAGAWIDDDEKTEVEFFPYVGLAVNRSLDAETLVDGSPIAALLRYRWKTVTVKHGDTCTHCEAGSPAYAPKKGDNWKLYFSNC